MTKQLLVIPLVFSFLLASGCATNLITMQQAQQQNLPEPNAMQRASTRKVSLTSGKLEPVLIPPSNSYSPRYSHKTLDDYAEQMTMELMDKARVLQAESRVGVASFVNFDASLQTTNPLGNQLAESFIKEVQAFGLAVVDYKMMDHINVAADGDKVFSRNARKLDDADVDFVLSGTMHRDEKGVRVNARIVSMEDRRVVATARGFIPHFVVNSVVPEYMLIPSA